MVVRSLKIVLILLLVCLFSGGAIACFGPKLFIGVPADVRGEVLTSIVAVYVKEKTGIDTERVKLEERNVLDEIGAERIDYGFVSSDRNGMQVIFAVDGLPHLVSGPRILDDLQFTTVRPAIERLQAILRPEHVDAIVQMVEHGELPMAAVRNYLLQKRWI